MVIFSTRNIKRLAYEMEVYQYKPFKNVYFKVEKPEYKKRFLKDGIILYQTNGSCWAIPQPCARNSVITGRKKNSYIYWEK